MEYNDACCSETEFKRRLVMQHHRFHWVQAGVAGLLAMLALSGCSRSASTVMTPLPSMPPPTATLALAPMASPTPTLPATARIAASATLEATEDLLLTETLQARPVTATQTPVVVTQTPGSATQASVTVACAGAPPTRLRIDSYAYVNPEPPLPNNLRSEAGENNSLIGDIQPGQAMKILEGPKCADGWSWWKVRTLETDLEGWTAEGDGQSYWLVPCSSPNECKP
jgi:hypothetical protein